MPGPSLVENGGGRTLVTNAGSNGKFLAVLDLEVKGGKVTDLRYRLLPGQPITREDVYNATAITYPAAYRTSLSGARLKEVLEDVADNLFNPDPYYQQGGDMVRVGGLTYTIDITKPIGSRISELTLARTGQAVEAGKDYVVSGWASVTEGTEGPAIWDVVFAHLQRRKTVAPQGGNTVRILGA
jgi:sulfur-oxidizing protein SoxB